MGSFSLGGLVEVDPFSGMKFVWEVNNFLPENFCQTAIQYFNSLEQSGLTVDRRAAEGFIKKDKDDTQIAFYNETIVNLSLSTNISYTFTKAFWQIHDQYVNQFSVLSDFKTFNINFLKMQKTTIGQGFHLWHFENSPRTSSARVNTFLFYCNTVQEGGETEFLYYPKRIKPEQGKLVLFPGDFTYAHRGNPPISNEKYVITGWVEVV